MANGASGRPKASELKSRCTANNAQGNRCGNSPAAGSGMCLAHLGQLDADERAELRRTRKDAIKLLAHARTEAIGALVQILMSGSVTERLAASRVILSVTSTPEESRMTNALLVADGLDDNDRTTVDSMNPAELVRQRLAAIAARKAAVDSLATSVNVPDYGHDHDHGHDHVGPAHASGTDNDHLVAAAVVVPFTPPLPSARRDRQLVPGRSAGPTVVDADADEDYEGHEGREPLSADLRARAPRPGSLHSGEHGAARGPSGAENAPAPVDETYYRTDHHADIQLGPVDPEPISVDTVDSVDSVDTSCSAAFTADGRGDQRRELNLPSRVGGRRRAMRGQASRADAAVVEVVVEAAYGVPRVTRRRVTEQQIAGRRSILL